MEDRSAKRMTPSPEDLVDNVWCWSGDDAAHARVPLGGKRAVQISPGHNHICILLSDGSVQCENIGYELLADEGDIQHKHFYHYPGVGDFGAIRLVIFPELTSC